jgi:polar amino acid transport system permease protein
MDASAWMMLLEGAWVTIWISSVSIGLGVIFGFAFALVRLSQVPVISQAVAVYVSIVRATPMVTLILFLFVAAPFLGLDIDRRIIAIAALTINTTAFNAEIWRSALATFPKEQVEAALASGMTRRTMMRRIMLPQMTITSLPGLVNEMSLLLKSSPAIAMVGVVDLARVANRIGTINFDPVPPIFAAGILYLIIIGILVRFQRVADKYAQRLAM